MEKQDRTQEMYDLVEQWQQSGVSQKQFSAQHNIKLPTFMYWIKKHRFQKQDIDGFVPGLFFIEMVTDDGIIGRKLIIR